MGEESVLFSSNRITDIFILKPLSTLANGNYTNKPTFWNQFAITHFLIERLYFYQQQIEERQLLAARNEDTSIPNLAGADTKSYDCSIPLPDSGYHTERSHDSMKKARMTSLSLDGDNLQHQRLHVSFKITSSCVNFI